MGITRRSIVRRGAADDRAGPPWPCLERSRASTGSEIRVSVARTISDRRAAADLIESRYAARGYRVTGLPDAGPELTLIAAADGAAVGTLTLRLDGPDGLRADEGYGAQIDAVRAAGKQVCELGRFAVASDARSTPVLAALFARAHGLVRGLREITDVFIEVNPRHADFYRKLFGFAVEAGGRICPRVLAPSVLLRLELASFEARLQEYATAFRSRRSLVAPLVLNQPPPGDTGRARSFVASSTEFAGRRAAVG